MRIVICGLPFVGKSTVFRAIVGKNVQPKGSASGKVHLTIGTLEIKDERLKNLAGLVGSQKITYPQISLVDLALMGEKSAQGIETALLREFEALAIVIASFSSSDPLADLKNIESELLLADLQLVQNRIEKLNKEKKAKPKKEEEPELLLLERISKALEEGILLKKQNFTAEDLKALAGFQLFSLKPMIVIANLSEEQLKKQQFQELERKVGQRNWEFFALCAKLETEIEELTEEERPVFLKEMGLESLSTERFIQTSLQVLEQIFFFTVVGKEARAWLIFKGTTALQAAGSVHSDMERGFIRAEVINYKDFFACGNFAQAKEKGLLRLESKEYLVQDGDIINFKFSV